MRHINAEFGFVIGFQLSENSSLTLRYTGDKEALSWQQLLGLKCYIDAFFTRDVENVITYNRGVSWSANPKKTFLIARELTLP